MLIARTEGNPFFLEESVRALVETGALAGERGAYRLARPLPAHPGARHGAGGAGGPHRPAGPRRTSALLQTASVIGKDVPFAAAPGDRRAARGRAAPRRSAASRPPSSCTRRASSRISSTPSSTPSPTRWPTAACSRTGAARLHARDRGGHRAPLPRSARRAHRAARPSCLPGGAVGDRRPHTSGRPDDKAVSRSAFREAVVAYEHALVAVEHLPETGETQEQAIDLRLDLRGAPAGARGHRPPARA